MRRPYYLIGLMMKAAEPSPMMKLPVLNTP
jgi:hypothetical protein